MIFLSKNYMSCTIKAWSKTNHLHLKNFQFRQYHLKTVDTVVEIKSTLFLFKGIVTFLDNAIDLQTLEQKRSTAVAHGLLN